MPTASPTRLPEMAHRHPALKPFPRRYRREAVRTLTGLAAGLTSGRQLKRLGLSRWNRVYDILALLCAHGFVHMHRVKSLRGLVIFRYSLTDRGESLFSDFTL